MNTRWAINGRFLSQRQTGVQRYAREITGALDALLAADDRRAARLDCELILPADCDEPPALQAIAVRRSRAIHGHLWEQTVLPLAARGKGLLSLANLGPLAHPRQIVCMHDVNVFLEPASYSRRFRSAYKAGLPVLARRSRAVTTVSAFSAAMLARYGVSADATVIGNGHEHALRWNAARSPFAAPDRFPRPFVFALGSRARHKRLDLLLDLAPALDARGIDLVISGGSAAIFAQTRHAMPRNVHPVGFVGDDDLAALFQRALCFAFPSRTEGFGLPLLEAMVHGAPIVAANGASLPEVCGEAALYAAPDDPAAWLAAIARLAGDDALRADLRARGYVRCTRFSWRTGAEAYLALAERLSVAPAGATAFSPATPIHPAA